MLDKWMNRRPSSAQCREERQSECCASEARLQQGAPTAGSHVDVASAELLSFELQKGEICTSV